MEVEINPIVIDTNVDAFVEEIVDFLVKNPEIQFKSQQRGESDLTSGQKKEAALSVYARSKFNFLTRFGRYLTREQLAFFEKFNDDSEMGILVQNLERLISNDKRRRDTRNRRYEALKQLIEGKSYFSETEMMKRNPLLYDQLIGQYLSVEERRLRDRADTTKNTFVKILMEGIERDDARDMQKQQEEAEDDAMEEDDTSEEEEPLDKAERVAQCSASRWGEFSGMQDHRINKDEFYPKRNNLFITATERELLREEFTTLMHQSFLDGKDDDFDYSTVDNNEEYDNIDIVNHDEEEKYFDAEEPDDADVNDVRREESSEDELDIYMNALNQNPVVNALSQKMQKL